MKCSRPTNNLHSHIRAYTKVGLELYILDMRMNLEE